MAKLPTVAIIGRPNTGKSTLFNRLIGRRKAIVSDIPGTTRDHIAHRIETETVDYLLIDTGGMGGGTADSDLEDDVHGQSRLALENADLIVLTLNSTEELTSSDHEVIDLLRKEAKQHVPVILAVTKCDTPEEIDSILPQYYALDIADTVIGVSAPHKIGLDDLQKEIVEHLEELNFKKTVEDADHLPTIAIVGKPNVGKSSIINAFMSETQRSKSPLLVSEIPGTTRDSTDTIIKYHDQEYRFIDTAGIKRRKQTVDKEIEVSAYFRSVRSIQECDICVLVLNATEELSRQDKRIANLVIEEGKGLIILVNKIDIASQDEKQVIMQFIEHELQFCKYAPVIPCSAETREGLLKLFDFIESVDRNRKRRIPTKDLNEWFKSTVAGQPLGPLVTSKHLTQAEEVPPTFVIFVKESQKVQLSQLRHLENSLRKTFALEGTPIRWVIKDN